ncbi:hypothetical protein SCHPADRAFT_992664 [Schizopora paradoxa]|uniref:DUF6534 domain-containing protein n=1 Tax=Schizopora paradoxa TaxID=27342 RepID=A0A0H2SRL2_9AGAM|nr:hypothetical protein SCHPADRAFT_992664 [Schizopora paradoxa]
MGALDESIGALFIGCLVTTTLFGVTCTQTSSYLRNHGLDSGPLVGTVVLLMVLDTLHTVLISKMLYAFVVTNFGIAADLTIIPWTLSSSLVVHIVSDSVVRIFFIRRVWLLSKQNTSVVGILSALNASTIGFILFVTIKSFELKSIRLLYTIHWEICTGLALVMATDLCIAASLCGYLYHSPTGGDKGTNSIINSICLYTINTGLLTTMCSLGCLLAYILSPNTLIFVAFYLPLSKFYVNAFLASLNARQRLREKSQITRAMSAKSLRLNNTSGATSLSTVNHGASHINRYSGQEFSEVYFQSSSSINAKGGSEIDVENYLPPLPSIRIGEAL